MLKVHCTREKAPCKCFDYYWNNIVLSHIKKDMEATCKAQRNRMQNLQVLHFLDYIANNLIAYEPLLICVYSLLKSLLPDMQTSSKSLGIPW